MKHILVFGMLVLVCGASVLAQPRGRPDPAHLERIERFKRMRLVEMLDLTEDQSVRFFPRLNEFENTRREIKKQKDEILDKIDRLIRNSASDQKEYEKLFAEIEAIDRKAGEEKLRFFNSLSDLLSIQQRAKLVLFERRFEAELRDAVREVQRRRGRWQEGN